MPFFAPRRTSCQSQNHLVNYTCIRVRACGLMRTLFIYVHIMRRVCTEILPSIFFLPLFLSYPKHFPAPLSHTRQPDLRPAGRFAEYLSRRLVMRWKLSKTAVAITTPPPFFHHYRGLKIAGKITSLENVSVLKTRANTYDTYTYISYYVWVCTLHQ